MFRSTGEQQWEVINNVSPDRFELRNCAWAVRVGRAVTGAELWSVGQGQGQGHLFKVQLGKKEGKTKRKMKTSPPCLSGSLRLLHLLLHIGPRVYVEAFHGFVHLSSSAWSAHIAISISLAGACIFHLRGRRPILEPRTCSTRFFCPTLAGPSPRRCCFAHDHVALTSSSSTLCIVDWVATKATSDIVSSSLFY